MPSVRSWIIIGLAVRAVLLWLSAPFELQSDEAHYAWLGLGWERFGFLGDSQRFLWPPAYPFLHKVGFQWFQDGGVLAVRVLQVFASAATGWAVAGLAKRFVSDRTAPVAAAIWALHLPLAGFCGLGWPDSLFLSVFLPALVLLHDSVESPNTKKLVAAGILFGASALFKEIGLAIAIAIIIWLGYRLFRTQPKSALPILLTFTFSVALPIAPWAARNLSHHDSLILSGKTLGENVYHGWNGKDRNFDVLPVARASGDMGRPDTRPARLVLPSDKEVWPRPGGQSLKERHDAKVDAGLRWVKENPGDFLRTRLGKAAHMFAPISFPVRHIALGNYDGPLGQGLAARAFIIVATLQSLMLILIGAVALAHKTARHALFWIPAIILMSQPLLVGMSRLRVPLTPFLFIAVAGLLMGTPAPRSRLATCVALAAASTLLLIDARPVLWLLGQAWELKR